MLNFPMTKIFKIIYSAFGKTQHIILVECCLPEQVHSRSKVCVWSGFNITQCIETSHYNNIYAATAFCTCKNIFVKNKLCKIKKIKWINESWKVSCAFQTLTKKIVYSIWVFKSCFEEPNNKHKILVSWSL